VGISVFQPAALAHDEAGREQAVEASGALWIRDDPVLDAIVARARRIAGTQMAAVSIIYRDWQYLIAASGLPAGPYSRRTSFCGHAILTRGPVFTVEDAGLDERFAGNPAVEDGRMRFYAGALICWVDEQPIGTLCVFDPRPRDAVPPALAAELTGLAAQVVSRLQQLGTPGEAERTAAAG
jgi:GAF domain-containing protein